MFLRIALLIMASSLLNACSVLSSGAISGANKAYKKSDYLETIRKSERALRIYSNEYSDDEKSQLMLLKAESLVAIGQAEKAQIVYQIINKTYPKTQAGFVAKKFSVPENSQAVISHYRYTAKTGMAINLAQQACLQGAKQEAVEQFGVSINTNNQFNSRVNSATLNQQESVTKNIQLKSEVTTSAHAKLQFTKLQESINTEADKLVVRCSIKAENILL